MVTISDVPELTREAGTLCDVTDSVIRRAHDADMPAITQPRRVWTREWDGEHPADEDFDERLAAWFAQESARRVLWLAEAAGRPVGMMNLASAGPARSLTQASLR